MISSVAVSRPTSVAIFRRKTPNRITVPAQVRYHLRRHNLEHTTPDRQEIYRLLALAKHNRDGANFNRDTFPELAYNADYFAILNGCDALLISCGYRARGFGGHKVAINCAASLLRPTYQRSALLLQQSISGVVRRTRCRAMYDGESVQDAKLAELAKSVDIVLADISKAVEQQMRRLGLA